MGARNYGFELARRRINLGEEIYNQFIDRFQMVTKDGKYLFFVTSHSNHFPSQRTHFYWVDAKIKEELRQKNSNKPRH